MRPLLRKKARVVAFVVIAAIGSTACVKQNDPGVGLVKFDSSAVFGQSDGQGDIPGFGTANPFPDSFGITELPVRNIVNRVPDIAGGPCPAAKLTAFPKTSSQPTIDGLPPVGVYQWKRVLSVVKNAAAEPSLTQRPFALESRSIRNVVRTPGVIGDHEFSFEMVSPDPFVVGNSVITTFKVNSNATLLYENNIPARTVGVVDVPGYDLRVVPPNDMPGIFISKIVTVNSSGVGVASFSPVQPVMILPLEGGVVRSGQEFRSIGIDATSGAVLTNAGLVGRKSRVDACGEIVEGYVVSLSQIYSGDFNTGDPVGTVTNIATRNQTRNIDYVFATQYGAMPIQETLSVGDIAVDPTGFIGKWELGGLTPAPLPSPTK
ncbi:MAG: hypothetical protein QOF21_2511 [Actinomycetota bacterium]|jgi:hypothetical protein